MNKRLNYFIFHLIKNGIEKYKNEHMLKIQSYKWYDIICKMKLYNKCIVSYEKNVIKHPIKNGSKHKKFALKII